MSARPPARPAAARTAEHYLTRWYYAWGGAADTGGGWAWRIGDGAAHHGYQNPLAAYALSTEAALAPKSADRQGGLGDQPGPAARVPAVAAVAARAASPAAATNSWDGQYGTPPAGTPTFYGMAYDWQPVYHDPP